ncbi:hypothetical protein H072_4569 [Dactylellina haptotyla CBS 200.50]|uniref:RBR-type E3 ubiquitin transferase n=1 Tax=Dactylellina haptotyla (strain CBS 200.50) TaxID=1284197 RepID=S8C1S1_DACHA|nr:hypothetical protein H072_4569 [Dactylellina haptotyla CBS 200.50]
MRHSKGKGKQKAAVATPAPPPPPPTLIRTNTAASDILSSQISTLALEPSVGISSDDERILEISTIAVIYPEFSKIGKLGGSFDIEITPSAPITTTFTLLDGGEDVQREETAEITHLPPLTFEFQLPKGYPYDSPPNFRLVSSWLEADVLSRLKAELVETWESLRDQAIFSCIDTLQSSADRLFDLPVPLSVRVNQKQKIGILEYDRAMKVKKFNEGTFDCGICLEPRKGLVCHRIHQCGHVFCKPCLKEYFSAMIKEGDVTSVQCLNYVCGKDLPPEEVVDEEGNIHKIPRKPGAIAPAELQLLVEQDMVERFLKLKRKRAFESMKNVVYCPRNFCRGPALRDSGEDQLAICQDCSLAFCADCGKTWHGYKASCRIPGVIKTEEEAKEQKLTEEFLETSCTPCPTCLIPISKSGGCNHMYCSRCGTHFCLLCGAFLFADNPYQHYSQTKSSCYNRLWEGVDEKGEIVPPPPPPAVEEPPQPMMIQIVVPGQAPRDINQPAAAAAVTPMVEPHADATIEAGPADPLDVVAGPSEPAEANSEATDASTSQASESEEDEDDTPLTPLSPEDEGEFWVIYGRNECFSEGYHMLESNLTIVEIAEFLRDWAMSINEHRKNKMGLGAYWRRLVEWRRKVRDPRLKNKQIEFGGFQFTDEALKAAKLVNRTEEEELQRRWWDIWVGGMWEIAANKEWNEDEVKREEDELKDFVGYRNHPAAIQP